MSLAGSDGRPVGRWLRDLGRAAQWHRRLVAAGLLAGSVAFALETLAPTPPSTVPALAVAADQAAGQRLRDEHLVVVRRSPAALPAGILRSPAAARGATLLSGVRQGELLTDVRLVGRAGITGLGPGLVAAPVRIADADAARLLRPGARVDVLAAGGDVRADGAAYGVAVSGAARLVAAAARVIAVPPARAGFGGGQEGALVLLATTESTAARLAGAAVTDRLSVVLRGQ